MNLLDRLMARVTCDDIDGCWEWTGARGTGGYGQVRLRGSKTTAHRAMFEAVKGAIDPELDIDHICRNRLCVNPAHLEAVTHRENIRRGAIARGVAYRCRFGHDKVMLPYGRMRCRECGRQNAKRFRERAKMKALTA